MAELINKQLWRQTLRQPDWYLKLYDDFRRLEKLMATRQGGHNPASIKAAKREAYELVETALEAGSIPLAESGENFDRERRPADTVIIHHTKNPPGMPLSRLNAMQLLRLYAPRFAAAEKSGGKPIWSNHFLNGRQVFYAYHWLIRQDGSCERLLEDKHIGWQAGCWHVNTRSIAVAIDDDLTNKQPGQPVLDSIASLIKNHYGIPPHLVIGHCEVFSKPKAADCPGKLFLSQWKQDLLQRL